MESLPNLLPKSPRLWRGVQSAAAGYLFPLGPWLAGNTRALRESTRLSSGLVIVLPGIEGRSSLTWNIVQGLQDADVANAIVIHDWTTGVWPLFMYHLRARHRNLQQADAVAQRILEYQEAWPGRPVHLIGHSGGGALAVWALEALPASHSVESAILLAPALSTTYNLAPALRKTSDGIWNFHSPYDLFFLAAGTLLFGTMDGSHTIAAGNRGFVQPANQPAEERALYETKLYQQRFSYRMTGRFHPGGHFGWTNRVFVAETLAPLLRDSSIDRPAA